MNKEFSRMQKLAGLITENMEGTNLDSTANDVYDYFSKKSSSTSTDRRNYIKDTYGLSDKDTEILMMRVTDMMSDDMNENMGGKNLNSVASDVHDHFSKMSSSTSTERREYIKDTYGLSDEDVETVMMSVTDMMSDEGDMREGVASYEYEMGKKAGEKEMGMEEGLNKLVREMKKEKNTDALRKKIREMILAEMDGAAVEAGYYDPVAEAKKDEEEVEDVDVDVTDEKMIGNDDPKVAEIQDLLNQLQDAAEELGDEKLLTQVGNTITFFTREHVANADNMG